MPFITNSTTSLSYGGGISRLLTAAVVNAKFCKLLLSDPAKALADGFNDEAFQLLKEEREQILSIKAPTLTDFAKQLVENRVSNQIYQPIRVQAELLTHTAVGSG